MLTIGLIVFLIILGVALLRLGLCARVQAARAAAEIAAQSAADAGLAQAMEKMNVKLRKTKEAGEAWDNSWIGEDGYQSEEVYLANGASFSFEITGDQSSGWQIASTGKSGVAEKTVHSMLKVQSLWFGIGVKQDIIAKAKAQFGTVPANSDFMLRTDSIEAGSVVLNNDVVVPGDVVVGPGGDPESVIILKEGAVIEGQTYAATEEIFYPPIRLPELTDWGIKMEVKGDTKTVGHESGHYRSGIYTGLRMIETASPGRIEIIDPNVVLYFTGDVDIGTKCEFVVREGASLTLYLDADLKTGEGSLITNESVTAESTDEEIALAAGSLKIYGTEGCTSIDLRTKSDFYGAIYAKNADLLLRNDGDLYGAFVGKSVNMNNSSGLFYYAAALAIVNIDDPTASKFGTERWWE